MTCRICHQPFDSSTELTSRHGFFWFSCKGCVKKARTKSRWHKRRKHGAGTFSPTDWLITLLEYEFKCAECQEKKPNLTLDHVLSLGEGGTNSYTNMQPLCEQCSREKARAENVRFYKRRLKEQEDEARDFNAYQPFRRSGVALLSTALRCLSK